MMHTVPTANGSRRKDPWVKATRTLAYALMGLSGVLLLLSPVLRTDLGEVGYTMAIFLTVGGWVSAFGCAFERWVGEYVGIPLLSASFAVFGIITTAGNIQSAPFIAFANLCLLFAVGLALLARWREARAVYRIATWPTRRRSDK